MVECESGQSSAPSELQLAWSCKRWNALPDAGAYLDQDYKLMTRMETLSNFYNALSRMRDLGQNIHHLTERERRLLRVLVDLGLIFT